MKVDKTLKAAALTLPKLADATGLSLPYLKQLSAGKRPASVDALNRLADAFDTQAKHLASEAKRLRREATRRTPSPD